MTDLAKTIAPKSDQLNADDLIAGPITITITDVRGADDPDQPIAVFFDGDGGKPYKPCKSMRRVMVHCWGADGKTYAGRRATLYCDPNVQFGGIKVGGIRISHMSHIDREKILPLTVTRAKRQPYKVMPLRAETASLAGARRDTRQEARPPAEDQSDADQGFSGGFGAIDTEIDDAALTEPARWARGVFDDLNADVFQSTADLDAFFRNPDNIANFGALTAEDEPLAKRLEAALRGRGKALAGRRG